MEWVSILALVFALSTVILAVLLIRHRGEDKRTTSGTVVPKHDRLVDMAQYNLFDGSIRDVARSASDLLVESFGCTRILYLRLQRGNLRVNFRHNITEFKGNRLGFTPTADLVTRLMQRPQLAPLDEFAGDVPQRTVDEIESLELDYVMPIGWRDNLYGLYFLSFDHPLTESQRAVIFHVVAQSVASAYHVRWHENKLDSLTRQMEQLHQRTEVDLEGRHRRHQTILRLLRRPEPSRVILELFESLCMEMGLSRAALFVADRDCSLPAQIHCWGMESRLATPPPEEVVSLADDTSTRRSCRLDELQRPTMARSLVGSLLNHRLERLIVFPLSDDRAAVLAYDADTEPETVDSILADIEGEARAVMRTADSFRHLQHLSCTDPLTELPNRRYFVRRIAEEVKRAKRFGRSLTLVFFDVDLLKQINDQYGHLMGDAVLQRLSRLVSDTIRSIDVLCRYGGDEFCIVMPETDYDRCTQFLERLSAVIAAHDFGAHSADMKLVCTVSMGAAIFPDHAGDCRGLLAAADAALLRSKESGRNSYRVYSTSA